MLSCALNKNLSRQRLFFLKTSTRKIERVLFVLHCLKARFRKTRFERVHGNAHSQVVLSFPHVFHASCSHTEATLSSAFCFLLLFPFSVGAFLSFFCTTNKNSLMSESDSENLREQLFCAKEPSQRIRRNSLRKRHNYTQKTRIKMSALTSSFTANLVSVKSAAKKSQKVVVGVQASNEFAKKVQKFLRFLSISFVIARRSVVRIRSHEWKNENVRIDLNKSDI